MKPHIKPHISDDLFGKNLMQERALLAHEQNGHNLWKPKMQFKVKLKFHQFHMNLYHVNMCINDIMFIIRIDGNKYLEISFLINCQSRARLILCNLSFIQLRTFNDIEIYVFSACCCDSKNLITISETISK